MRSSSCRFVGLVATFGALLVACESGGPAQNEPAASSEGGSVTAPATVTTTTAVTTATTPATAAPHPVIVLVGDIASCATDADDAVADLVRDDVAIVALLGDTVYDRGTAAEFTQCFDPAWRRHFARLRPVPGNHDYGTKDAADYFSYFGTNAGEPALGWYSYDVGSWHVVALNSNCGAIGGCDDDSPQGRWLHEDLGSNRSPCVVAYWHHPRASSGQHGDVASSEPLWRLAFDLGVDVVFAGHDHHYERFGPLGRDGEPDPTGVPSYVVGTGGASSYATREPRDGSVVAIEGVFGLVEMTLEPGAYRTDFVTLPAGDVADVAGGTCR